MAAKRLEEGSIHSDKDLNSDGVVTDAELETSEKLQEMQLSTEKADAQRAMAWFALLGMLLYPSLVVISSWIGLQQAANLLGNMAPTYYVSTAALVASYYGASAWQNRGNGK